MDAWQWLSAGRLRLAIEVELLEWLTVQAQPLIVTNGQPPLFNQAEELRQSAEGWGPIAGASIGGGVWLGGDSFNGSVLRGEFRWNSFRYEARSLRTSAGGATSGVTRGDLLDTAIEKQRRLNLGYSSFNTWSWFTLVAGIGLEYELDSTRRCIVPSGTRYAAVTEECGDSQLEISLDQLGGAPPRIINLRGDLHPVSLNLNLAIGVTFE